MDVYDTVVSSCHILLLLSSICLVSVACGNKLSNWGKSNRASTIFSCLESIVRWLWHGSPHDERVAVHMAERRLRRMQVAMFIMLIGNGMNGVTIVLNIVSGKPRINSVWMDIATIGLISINIGFNVCPGLLSRMPNVLYSTWMVWAALYLSPITDSTDPMISNWLFAFRMFCSMAILDMRTIIFWNAVNGTCAWCTFAFLWKDKQCAVVQINERQMAVREIYSFMLIVSICFGFKQGIVAEIREKLGANAFKRECIAVTAVLGAMSDVVVKLDRNLHVMGECSTLAALLLRESVRNTQFEQFLFSEADVKQFHDCIARTAANETAVVSPWSIRLRDGVGTCVTAECFHTALEDILGETFHMIGIREREPEAASEAAVINAPEPGSVQTTPMPPHMFLELILQETCGVSPAASRRAACTSARAPSLSGQSSPSGRSRRSSRSSSSSRSSRSNRSNRSSSSRRSNGAGRGARSGSTKPNRGSITALRESGIGVRTETSHSENRGSSQAGHVLIGM